jgi:leucyl aminopeptidase (aminopeptidase T)
MPTTPEVARVYQHALLQTDYRTLGARQRELESALRDGEVRVTTPAGTDIRFRVGDRPVTKQDGDASAARARQARNLIDREIELPAGAIRVAPLEESVEGRIVFPPGLWGGERVDGLVLTFSRGRVTQLEARTGRDAVERELAAGGDAARRFREFALGMNPLLAIPGEGRPWIPYYGYGAGVVRLSLGDNSELGGTVRGPYTRWNFFTDATVTVAGQRGGRLAR